jgi:hypothetical protein
MNDLLSAIPSDIKDNKSIKKYTKILPNNEILGVFVRNNEGLWQLSQLGEFNDPEFLQELNIELIASQKPADNNGK